MHPDVTRKLMAAMLVLSAATATAQTVQKCATRSGQVRYQSEPCARGERIVEVWSAVPDPVPDPARASPRNVATRRLRSPPQGRARFASARSGSEPDACTQARAYRDAAERQAGLDRNYDLLSTLQRRVFDACK